MWTEAAAAENIRGKETTTAATNTQLQELSLFSCSRSLIDRKKKRISSTRAKETKSERVFFASSLELFCCQVALAQAFERSLKRNARKRIELPLYEKKNNYNYNENNNEQATNNNDNNNSTEAFSLLVIKLV